MNPFNTPTTKNPFAATTLGIAVNTITGLPKAAEQVGTDILQGIARSAGSAGLTLAKPFGGVDSLKASDLSNPFSQELFHTFFGTAPIKPIEDKIAEAEQVIKRSPFAQKIGASKYALPLAFGGVYGSDLLNLVPFGGIEKNAVQALTKEGSTEGTIKILQAMKVPQEIATKFAPHFAEAQTPAEVQDTLDVMKGALGVHGVDAVNASKGVVPGDAKATLANIQEKLGVKPVDVTQKLEDAKLHLSFIEDAMVGHPGQGAGKYLNWRNGEFTKGADAKFQQAVGQDLSGGGDMQALEQASSDYKALQAQAQEVKSTIKTLSAEAKTTPSTALSKGEVKSLEEAASQARPSLPDTTHEPVSSLEDIIAKPITGVKDKVNVLDYLRTPDRVLEKIGFGKEAQQLRQGYEAYAKELPQNIDKITAWSKQVPAASSKTIFQYLDGQKVTLSSDEQRVAGEIKSWLSEWATRLNLPQDNTITHYITHIFDPELVKKEFPEELANIITDKVPGSVYDPFLLKRLGAKGYKENVWEALDAYVKRATRKVNLDEALSSIQGKAGSSLERSNVEASQFKYIQRYVSAVNMRPTELDNLLDNGLKSVVGYKYGQRPVTHLAKLLRQLTYRGLLGLNPASALRNLSQGINTYATLGEKYTAIGYAKLLSHGAFKELAEEGVLAPGFIQDRNLSSTKKAMEKIDKGLFSFFEAAEHINRGSAYFGAKAKALSEGKSIPEAVEYAKSVVRKTQFSFGSIDTPVALSSDIAKTLAQFQNYTIKQTEFLTEMAKDKNFVGLLRYAVAGTVFVSTIGKAFGMKPGDLIPSFGLNTPPSLKFPTEVAKAAIDAPDKYGKQRTLGRKVSDVANSIVGLIPGGSQIKKTTQGLAAYGAGKDTTATGRTRYTIPQDTEHFLQALLFGKNALPEAQAYFNKTATPAPTTNPFNN